MRRLATLAVVAALISPTAASGQDYTFGDWARDQGYSPGDVMPETVLAMEAEIDSLDGIDEFDWTTTPTLYLDLGHNQISNIESGDFSGLTKLTKLYLHGNEISSIESDDFSELTNLTLLSLGDNQISSIESGAFSGMKDLWALQLGRNTALTELNLAHAVFSNLSHFDVAGNENITSVSLRNAVVNQASLARLLDGGGSWGFGIGELDGITEMDLSGVDFIEYSAHRDPLYVMDDLIELWLVDAKNIDAA